VALAAAPVRLGEVVVTAPAASESELSRVAVVVAGADRLRQAGARSIRDLRRLDPGLQLEGDPAGANVLVNMRGVGERQTDAHVQAPISLFIDGAYVSFGFAASQPLVDVDHVEVLPGPQGTQYGPDDTGGIVAIVNKGPTRRLEGYGRATLGSYGEHALEGAVSGPLGPTVSARLSAYWRRSDNYVRNVTGGAGLGADRTAFVRAQVLFEPSPDFSLLLNARHWRVGVQPGAAVNYAAAVPSATIGGGPSPPASLDAFRAFCAEPFPGFPFAYGAPTTLHGNCFGATPGRYEQSFNDDVRYRVRLYGVTATAKLNLGDGITLSAMTDYLRLSSHFDIDFDGSSARLVTGTTGLHGQQFSEDLRLVGNEARARWLLGLYYLRIDPSATNVFDAPEHPIFLQTITDAYRAPSRAWAAYAHGEFDMSPQVTLAAGLRYGVDHKVIRNTTTCVSTVSGPFPGFPFTSTCDPLYLVIAGTVHALPGFSARLNRSAWAGKLQVNWTPTAALTLYAQLARGTTPGGFNSAGGFPLDVITYRPSHVTSYEAGTKWRSPRWNLVLGADAFHYDYRDFQTNAADLLGRIYIFNINAVSTGAETTLHAEPVTGLGVELNAAYLDAVEKQVPLGGELTTQPMPFAPRWRLTSQVRYEFDWLGGRAALQADWQHTTRRSTIAVDSPMLRIPEEDVVDVLVSWATPRDRLTVAARVDNLTGAAVVDDRLDFSGLAGGVGTFYDPPRWFHLTATYDF
jgi:iron complex outermembrane receptor protein